MEFLIKKHPKIITKNKDGKINLNPSLTSQYTVTTEDNANNLLETGLF